MAKVVPTLDYWVSGSGPFPVDMLRQDEAWPATSFDATLVMSGEPRVRKIAQPHNADYRRLEKLRLACPRPTSEGLGDIGLTTFRLPAATMIETIQALGS